MTTGLPSSSGHPLRLPPVRRRRWLTLLLVLAVFVAGAVAGSGFTVLFVIHRLQHAIHHPEEAPERITKMLRRRLDLNDQQTARVRAIVAERQADLQTLRLEFQPKLEQQLDLLRDQISAVLTDSQRHRWQRLVDEFRRRWLPLLPEEPASAPK